LPVDPHPQTERRTAELIVTGAFSNSIHGINYGVVNAVSERFVVDIARDGYRWHMEFRRGELFNPLERGEPTKETGTSITFWPDHLHGGDALRSGAHRRPAARGGVPVSRSPGTVRRSDAYTVCGRTVPLPGRSRRPDSPPARG